ncbi:MAG: PAS domain S-box protein [Myxococcales bacterium]
MAPPRARSSPCALGPAVTSRRTCRPSPFRRPPSSRTRPSTGRRGRCACWPPTSRRANGKLDQLLASVADGVLVYDRRRTVVRANAAGVAALGFDPVGLERGELERRLALEWPDGRGLTAEELPGSRALGGETVQALRLVLPRDGRRRHFSVSCAPRQAGGRVTGAVSVWHDVTAFEEAREALRQSESRFRTFFETPAVGTAELRSRAASWR